MRWLESIKDEPQGWIGYPTGCSRGYTSPWGSVYLEVDMKGWIIWYDDPNHYADYGLANGVVYRDKQEAERLAHSMNEKCKWGYHHSVKGVTIK